VFDCVLVYFLQNFIGLENIPESIGGDEKVHIVFFVVEEDIGDFRYEFYVKIPHRPRHCKSSYSSYAVLLYFSSVFFYSVFFEGLYRFVVYRELRECELFCYSYRPRIPDVHDYQVVTEYNDLVQSAPGFAYPFFLQSLPQLLE